MDSWAAHGQGWVAFEYSHMDDYLQLALMLRHPDLEIVHAALGPCLFRIRGALGKDVIDQIVRRPHARLRAAMLPPAPLCTLHPIRSEHIHPHLSHFLMATRHQHPADASGTQTHNI